ncbi:Processing alpha glucosidase I, partial [Nowakowskiella sp. JEL0078]
LDAIKHWATLIDDQGWVGREQILGDEARSKVPREFQTQYPNYANPPFLLAGLNSYLDRIENSNNLQYAPELAKLHIDNPAKAQEYLEFVYEKFSRQYNWFLKTQSGEVKKWGRKSRGGEEAYRWRGRTPNHCLTSGLDDYPRAPIPHAGEIHVDLMSWIGFMSQILRRIALKIGREDDAKAYSYRLHQIKLALIDLHWNHDSQSFCDATYDEDSENSKFIVHKGYVSLFPLLFGLIEKDSEYLLHTLELIRNEQELWTPYGLASLSQSDSLFESDEDYWRGAIWMNINYLVLSSLYKNYMYSGVYAELAKQIYTELRQNLIKNIHSEYERTGYLWEQYSPHDGKGRRSHPFTGWTSLIVLIMAEIY